MENLPRISIYPETAQEFFPNWEDIIREELPTLEVAIPKGKEAVYLQEIKDALVDKRIFAYRFSESKFPTKVLGIDGRTPIEIFLLK